MVATVTLAVNIVDPTLSTPAVGRVDVSVPVVLRDTVEAGHLDGGVVRFVLVCKGNGAGVLYASEAFPFYWRAVNSGPGGEIA